MTCVIRWGTDPILYAPTPRTTIRVALKALRNIALFAMAFAFGRNPVLVAALAMTVAAEYVASARMNKALLRMVTVGV